MVVFIVKTLVIVRLNVNKTISGDWLFFLKKNNQLLSKNQSENVLIYFFKNFFQLKPVPTLFFYKNLKLNKIIVLKNSSKKGFSKMKLSFIFIQQDLSNLKFSLTPYRRFRKL
jgi:hypothetical protein